MRLHADIIKAMIQEDLFSEAELNDLGVQEFDKSEYIVDEDRLSDIAKDIRRAGQVAFDIETNGFEGDLIGVGLAWKSLETVRSVYIPVGHVTQAVQIPLPVVLRFLTDLFKDVLVLPFNAGFELKVMQAYNVPIPQFTDVRYYAIADDERNYRESLKDIAEAKLGLKWGTIKELCSRKVKVRSDKGRMVTKTVIDIPGTSIEKLGKYCRTDAEATLKLYDLFQPTTVYAKEIIALERQVTPVVVAMEQRGIKIDLPAVHLKLEETKKRLLTLETEILTEAGKAINLNSPKQVSELLFDELKLRPVGGRSVDVNTLQELKDDHPIPRLMLEYRELEKLRSTYLEPLMTKNVNGRVFTSLNQLGTETGRFSSSKPNMQNVPIDPSIRKLFVASDGMLLLDYDYSQIEGRVFAHVSQDKTLLEYYRNGGDIHAATSEKLGIPRKLAKTINFAIIYGAAPRKLSESMQKEGFSYDPDQAKDMIRNFWKLYSGGSKWAYNLKKDLHKEKAVFTAFGRRRTFPDIAISDKFMAFSMEREAVNFVIQGTAADIMKYALVGCYKALKLTNFPAHPLLTVHDEILFEGTEEKYEQADRIIRYQMVAASNLTLPMEVEGKKGQNWAECH
jgi:DNA polymerase-1